MAGQYYKPGDFYRICDRSGYKVRASETTKEWTGRIVRDKEWEPRHPQDFTRGKYDKQSVPDPRPEPADRTVGPLVTNISATDGHAVGVATLTVISSSGMSVNDNVQVTHEGGTLRTTISAVPSSTSLTLAKALPATAPFGAAVVDEDVVTTATDQF